MRPISAHQTFRLLMKTIPRQSKPASTMRNAIRFLPQPSRMTNSSSSSSSIASFLLANSASNPVCTQQRFFASVGQTSINGFSSSCNSMDSDALQGSSGLDGLVLDEDGGSQGTGMEPLESSAQGSGRRRKRKIIFGSEAEMQTFLSHMRTTISETRDTKAAYEEAMRDLSENGFLTETIDLLGEARKAKIAISHDTYGEILIRAYLARQIDILQMRLLLGISTNGRPGVFLSKSKSNSVPVSILNDGRVFARCKELLSWLAKECDEKASDVVSTFAIQFLPMSFFVAFARISKDFDRIGDIQNTAVALELAGRKPSESYRAIQLKAFQEINTAWSQERAEVFFTKLKVSGEDGLTVRLTRLVGLGNQERFEQAQQLWIETCTKFGQTNLPNAAWNTWLEVLCRNGRLKETLAILQSPQRPFTPDRDTAHLLLVHFNSFKTAKEAIEKGKFCEGFGIEDGVRMVRQEIIPQWSFPQFIEDYCLLMTFYATYDPTSLPALYDEISAQKPSPLLNPIVLARQIDFLYMAQVSTEYRLPLIETYLKRCWMALHPEQPVLDVVGAFVTAWKGSRDFAPDSSLIPALLDKNSKFTQEHHEPLVKLLSAIIALGENPAYHRHQTTSPGINRAFLTSLYQLCMRRHDWQSILNLHAWHTKQGLKYNLMTRSEDDYRKLRALLSLERVQEAKKFYDLLNWKVRARSNPKLKQMCQDAGIISEESNSTSNPADFRKSPAVKREQSIKEEKGNVVDFWA